MAIYVPRLYSKSGYSEVAYTEAQGLRLLREGYAAGALAPDPNRLEAPATLADIEADNAVEKSTFAPHLNGLLIGLGDSIPAAGDDLANGVRSDSYNHWAAVLSGGRLMFVRNAGRGGDKLSDMIARFTTDVVPYATPGTLITCDGGTNDFTFGVSDAAYRANVKAIVALIRGIGCIPHWVTPGPINSAGAPQKLQIATNGAWLVDYCAQQGIGVTDMLALIVDPATSGNYKAAYDNGDGIHPKAAGHFALGADVAAKYAFLTPRTRVARYTSDPANLLTNGFMQAGGPIATGWNQNWGVATGTADPSIFTDAAVPGGKAQRFTLAAATDHIQTHQSISTGWSVGDKMRLSSIVSAVGAQVHLEVTFTGPGTWSSERLAGGDFTRAEMVNDFTIPAGTTALDVVLWAGDRGAGAVTGTADFAAVTLRNLTTGGLVGPY